MSYGGKGLDLFLTFMLNNEMEGTLKRSDEVPFSKTYFYYFAYLIYFIYLQYKFHHSCH